MIRFAIVCDWTDDFEIASELADRVFLREHEWLDGYLDFNREWCGEGYNKFFSWSFVKLEGKKRGLAHKGHFNGIPAKPYAVAADRAVQLLRLSFDGTSESKTLHGVVIMPDSDADPARQGGLEQGVSPTAFGGNVIKALVRTKRECWVLNGFVHADDDERDRLKQVREKLGFDPTLKAHLLTATNDAPKCPKRVLKFLTQGDRERESRCWREVPLDELESRGKDTGLRAYLEAVRKKWTPLFIRPTA